MFILIVLRLIKRVNNKLGARRLNLSFLIPEEIYSGGGSRKRKELEGWILFVRGKVEKGGGERVLVNIICKELIKNREALRCNCREEEVNGTLIGPLFIFTKSRRSTRIGGVAIPGSSLWLEAYRFVTPFCFFRIPSCPCLVAPLYFKVRSL